MGLKNFFKTKYQSELVLFIIFAITFMVIGFIIPDKFFTLRNITSMAFQMPELGLLSLAMMAVVLTGGINLSIATTASLTSILAAFVLSSSFATNNPLLGIIIAFVVIVVTSLIMGAINGVFVSYVGVAAMLVTLGTMTLFEGIGLNLTKGGAISGFPSMFMMIGNKSFLGVPIPIIIYIVVVIVSYLLLEKTVWGVNVHMVGSNPTATEFSGINVRWTIFKVYLYSALMSGLAGMIMISRYNSAKTDYGSSYVMQAITAVVLGGTSIYGGHGTVLGTVIAVAIIQVVSTGLNIIGINRNIVDITIGAILILVLSIRYLTKVLSDRSLIQARKQK